MVDYRRWDRLEVSSSEDENSSKKMRVQRFAEKQRVTIGPQGISIGEQEDEEEGKKGEETTKERENEKRPGKSSKAGETASSNETRASDLKPQQQGQLQQQRQPTEEQLLQKARREMEEEKKGAENMIDAGGDLQEDEAFEDAHEWPRCGPLAAPLSPQEEEYDEEEEEDRKTAGDGSSCGWSPRGRGEGQSSSSSSKEEEEEEKNRSSASRGKKSRTEGLGSSRSRTSHSGGAGAAALEVALVDNGGVVEKRYFWRQTKHEVTVDLLLPRGARGRDVCCEIKEDSCCCMYKGETLLKGEFPHKVEEDEDMWLWELVEKKINWTKLQRIAAAHNRTASAPPPPQRQQKQQSSGSSRTRREVTEGEPHQPPESETAGDTGRVDGSSRASEALCTSSKDTSNSKDSSSGSSSKEISCKDSSCKDSSSKDRSSKDSSSKDSSSKDRSSKDSSSKDSSSRGQREPQKGKTAQTEKADEQEGTAGEKKEAARELEAASVEAEDTEKERERKHKQTNAEIVKEEKATFLELTLRKKPEVAGTFVWWNCVIKGDPCIDVQQIPGRASKEKTTRDFKAAWESAHRMFFEKLKNEERQRIQV